MTSGGKPRVLVADDHPPTREEIVYALERGGEFQVCAVAADAAEAVAAAIRERPDVCLLDIRMPGSGIAALWEIHTRLPMTKIVMLTVSDHDGDLFGSLRGGAAGYLLKDVDPRRLTGELTRVLAGEVALPRSLVGRVVDELRDRTAHRRTSAANGPLALLTSREWQVLDLLSQGLTTRQIAQRLVVSPITVRTHTNSILTKLQIEDRAELVRRFERRQ